MKLAVAIAALLLTAGGCQVAGRTLAFVTELCTSESEKQAHAMDQVFDDPNHRTVPNY
jgi:hypothetical protein